MSLRNGVDIDSITRLSTVPRTTSYDTNCCPFNTAGPRSASRDQPCACICKRRSGHLAPPAFATGPLRAPLAPAHTWSTSSEYVPQKKSSPRRARCCYLGSAVAPICCSSVTQSATVGRQSTQLHSQYICPCTSCCIVRCAFV